MRVGCLGCLVLSVLLVGVGIIIGGVIVFSSSIFDLPDPPQTPKWTSLDGQRAQQKILEILRRDSRMSSRTDPLFFTEQEVNAFVARHMEESEGMPVSPLLVKLNTGVVVIRGKTQLKTLLRGFPFNYVAQFLPASQVDRPVWVVIQATVRIEHGRVRKEREFLLIEPLGFRIGTQEAGTWLLSRMLGRTLFRWRVPKVIEGVSVEEGRVIITTRSG